MSMEDDEVWMDDVWVDDQWSDDAFFEPEQLRALAFCPKIPAAVSILCSGYIVYAVMSDHQKRALPRERILLAMSCSDILFSFFWFLSTWPIPRGTECEYAAVGNAQTCTVQGFFIQLGVMTPMYNGFLAFFCFLYVCRDWRREQMKYVEICGHICILAFGFSTAIAGIPMGLYNDAAGLCWISESPYGCTESFQSIDGTTDCIRGDNATIYRWAFFYGMVWINIGLTFYFMAQIYHRIRKQESMMEAYTSEFSEYSRRKKAYSESRRVAIRGALFSVAFFISWLPMTLEDFLLEGAFFLSVEGSYYLGMFTLILTASQGTFNFLIYIQPAVSRYFKARKTKRMDTLLMSSMQGSIERNSSKHREKCSEGKDSEGNSSKLEDISGEENEKVVEDPPPTSLSITLSGSKETTG